MRARTAVVAAAAAAAVVAAAGAWWFWPSTAPVAPSPTAAREASRFQGVELTEQDADGTRWRIAAEEGAAWEASGTGELRGIKAVFERRDRSISVTAGRGNVKGADVVNLSDGVTIQWDRYQAKLDGATYERGKGVVRSADPVEFRGPGIEVKGRGLEIDVEGRRAHVPGGVHAIMRPEAAP